MNHLNYFLALNRMNRVGPRIVSQLLDRWPNLEIPFSMSADMLKKEGIPAWLAHNITSFDMKLIEEDIRWMESSTNHHLLTWESSAYPQLLQEIYDPPIVLYAHGQLSAFQPKPLAIIGSRNPSVTGIDNARRFAKELAAHNITIVSGLALGIDAAAHQGCLDAEGQTIAVLGTGIDCIYPRRHSQLAQQIVQNGLLLSEFPLKSPPIAGHFPRRNRIISGLTLCTLVIEAAIRSGSLITARMAMEQNRDVLAIPGSIHNPMARGCNHLLQQGARLATSVQDVLDELGVSSHLIQKEQAITQVMDKTNTLMQFIGFDVTSIDHIITRSGYTIEQVISELATLELQGIVQSVQGGYLRCSYER
jgi:DNA processing protein